MFYGRKTVPNLEALGIVSRRETIGFYRRRVLAFPPHPIRYGFLAFFYANLTHISRKRDATKENGRVFRVTSFLMAIEQALTFDFLKIIWKNFFSRIWKWRLPFGCSDVVKHTSRLRRYKSSVRFSPRRTTNIRKITADETETVNKHLLRQLWFYRTSPSDLMPVNN